MTKILVSLRKRPPWRGHNEVNHNQVLNKSKVGSEEPVEWLEQSQVHQNVYQTVNRNSVGIIVWPKEEIEATYIKSSKILKMQVSP